MKRIILSLAVALVASQTFAATLYYTKSDGIAVIDPTDRGANPTGKVLAYNIASNGKFAADAARTSVFPPPAPTFFENTANVIGDNDFAQTGVGTTINLGVLFAQADRPNDQAGLEALFTNRIYVGASGGGELALPVVFVPEPATAGLAGLCMLGFAAIRRRMA